MLMNLDVLISSLEDQPEAVLFIMAATVCIVLFALAAFLIKTRTTKNWYDENLLEMAAEAEHVRRKAFNRNETEDTYDGNEEGVQRKPSRIIQVKNAVVKSLPMSGDLSSLFHIPKMKKKTRSMFTNPNQKEFDKGLYLCQAQDESVCTEEMGTAGSIQMSLAIDSNLGILNVTLKQAIDIPSKRQEDNPNPYFRVTLETTDGQKMEFQTKTYKNTSSPTIDEEYCFQVPQAQIGTCRLEIMVYDYDQFSVDECVAYCWLTLGRITVSTDNESPTVFWAEVLPYDENGGKGFGEVLFSLSYISTAQRLTMNVFKARNLKCNNDTNGSVSMRVSLIGANEKKLKRKKSSSRRIGKSLQFNEPLSFNVPKHSLCDVQLEIEAVQETGTFGMTSQVVGRMELPLHMCKDLWRSIIREEQSQARWYPLEEP